MFESSLPLPVLTANRLNSVLVRILRKRRLGRRHGRGLKDEGNEGLENFRD